MKFPRETIKKIMDIQIDEENNTLSFLLPKQITYRYPLRKNVVKKCTKQHEFLTVCNVCRNSGEYEDSELCTVTFAYNVTDVNVNYERKTFNDGKFRNFREICLSGEIKDQLKNNVIIDIDKPIKEKELAEEVVDSYTVYGERITVELNNEINTMHIATTREYKIDCICGEKYKGTNSLCVICQNNDLTYKKFVASEKQLIPQYKYYREFNFDSFTFKNMSTAFFTSTKGKGLYRNILTDREPGFWSSYASFSKEGLNPLFSLNGKETPFKKNIKFDVCDHGDIDYYDDGEMYTSTDKYNLVEEILIKDKQQIICVVKKNIETIINNMYKNIDKCEDRDEDLLRTLSCKVEIEIGNIVVNKIQLYYKDLYACKNEECEVNTLVENIVKEIVGV